MHEPNEVPAEPVTPSPVVEQAGPGTGRARLSTGQVRSDTGHAAGTGSAGERVRQAAGGLAPLLAQADAVWTARAERPGWRPFEDAFPTFYQFTNRPR